MTDATYALHTALLRLAKGMLQAWEKWLVVSSGSIDWSDRASRQMPARGTDALSTQSTARDDERRARSAVG